MDSSAELRRHRPTSAPLSHLSASRRCSAVHPPSVCGDEAVMQPAGRAVGVPAPRTPLLASPHPIPSHAVGKQACTRRGAAPAGAFCHVLESFFPLFASQRCVWSRCYEEWGGGKGGGVGGAGWDGACGCHGHGVVQQCARRDGAMDPGGAAGFVTCTGLEFPALRAPGAACCSFRAPRGLWRGFGRHGVLCWCL